MPKHSPPLHVCHQGKHLTVVPLPPQAAAVVGDRTRERRVRRERHSRRERRTGERHATDRRPAAVGFTCVFSVQRGYVSQFSIAEVFQFSIRVSS